MQAVKVLSKGQITLPKRIRKALNVKEGDTIVIGKEREGFIFKKGKTIYDYFGFLPKPDISIEELVEKSIEAAVKDCV